MDNETDSDLATVRAGLLARLAEIDDLSAESKATRRPVELDQASVGRLSRMDAIQGQAMAMEAERRREVQRQRIEQALRRIESGDYGYCVSCGEPIAEKRLALDLTIPNCIRCAG